MRHMSNLLVAAATGVVLSACAAGPGANDRPAIAPGSDAVVQVTNNNWSDVRVYAERDGLRIRLGRVTSMGTEVFRMPAVLMASTGPIRLIADPLGSSETHVTHGMLVWAGQRVNYTVSNDLRISTAAVHNR
jgi:hypothetical protein